MKTLVQVLGPTGVGKSALAIAIARRFTGDIISADSVQVYRGFDIGSDKLPLAERQGVPHHLIDIIGDASQFNAARFLELTYGVAESIRAAGRLPVMCGGTAFYLRVIMRGIFPEQKDDGTTRRELQERADREGLDALWRELHAIDPGYADKIGPHDQVRIVRALEIARLHHAAPTHVFAHTQSPFHDYRFIRIGLDLARPELYARINARVERMITAGLLAEVQRLQSVYPPQCPGFKAVGYREIVAHLAGECGWPATVELIKQHTRNFAKRQLTWFRHEHDITWFRPGQTAAVLAFLEEALCNAPS
jgi:tRNA dimethylallyltransferase